jgi:hypothetical protein
MQVAKVKMLFQLQEQDKQTRSDVRYKIKTKSKSKKKMFSALAPVLYSPKYFVVIEISGSKFCDQFFSDAKKIILAGKS